MAEVMEYYSTNHKVPNVTLDKALLQGQAADKGLFLPELFPPLTGEELLSLQDKSYPEIAYAVLSRFTQGIFTDTDLLSMCHSAYNYSIPLERVVGRRFVMRLDQGPTASFKDFAARMMARWMGHLMQNESGELVILTATSGDTGSAVAHAYHGIGRIKIVVLFPIKEVSDRQRKQMTTLGGNVRIIGIDGKFDEGQAMVKRAFADPDLSGIHLTSANSINIGRLLPQSVYYVYAYLKLADVAKGEKVIFSIPSGNFGDMMGGIIAKQMGLPIHKFVIATNANDEVPRFIKSGEYQPIIPSKVCISNAMNVGHPSNLARLIDIYGGHMDERGNLLKKPDMDRLRHDLFAVSVDDKLTRETIKEAWETHHLLLEPHGATGWAGLKAYLDQNDADNNMLCISLETAHPAKFPEEIQNNINITPEIPPSLAGLENKPEDYPTMPADYDYFRNYLLEHYSH